MDPSIVKFLEEDEDETMHSGADVDAFTAALNRDIEGDNTPNSQPPTSTESGSALSQGTNHTPSQLFQQWQSSNREEEVKPLIQQQHQSSAMEVNRHGSGSESQHQPNDTSRDISHVTSEPNGPQDDKHNVQNIARNTDNESQLQRMQRTTNQQAMPPGQTTNAVNRSSGKQVPFGMLLPVIEPQLDKDRAMQLQGLYVRLKANNINKEEFVRHMRTLVGDHMLKMAVYKLQQGQLSAKQNTQKPSPYVATSSIHQSSDSSSLPTDNNPQKTRVLEHQSDSHGVQQPSHIHFPQSSFPNYGNPNYHPGSSPNTNMSSHSFKQQTHDLQMRQGPVHMGPTQSTNPMSLSERQNVLNEMKRMHGAGLTHFTNNSPNSGQLSTPHGIEQVPGSSKDEMVSSRTGFSTPMNKPESMSITAQLERQNVSAGNSSMGPGNNAKTPPKKPTVGQKKPLEAPVSAISKKQKVSGAFSDQSIEQLNDVTAVSGVNLREEEEQLFSGSKEDSRVSEASRKVVQEEEERLILQKIPLQKKLAEIMAKCGVKNTSNDVERCLSLCVEERMRGLISNLIRISKQRVDIEKPRHLTVITSDVRQQIMSMNQKAREEWEKKQADAEKLQRADESEGSGDGEDGRGKSKANKEDDDKMRTTAANVAARAAVGGDDMLSKWQLMAEQARQKREGGPDPGSTSQPSVDIGPKPITTSDRNSKDNSDTERTSAAVTTTTTTTTGPVRKTLRKQDLAHQNGGIARTISVKDVISVLEREIQMSRSTLIYRFYEKIRSDSVSE